MAKKNPEVVYDLILAFSKYLRGNIESLVEQDMVSFEQELDHVKAYIKLEQIHKSDRIRIAYEIKNNDFFLPRRIIEVLVENAVKHGISSKAEGGTIRLCVQRVERQYEILVEDDGVGFDVNSLCEEKYRGFYYVRTKLAAMPNSDMRIESTPGEGTRVSLRFCSIED
jgi:LytS/YehU family sensor histidine kinase